MLKLLDVTLSMRDMVNHHLLADKNPVCELSFSNLFIWRFGYSIQIADYSDMLLVQMEDVFGTYFLPPCGGGNFQMAVEALIAHCQELGTELRFSCVSIEAAEKLETLFPNRFTRKDRRDLHDYVHVAESLASLVGRPFHGKRNHVNKFIANYTHEYQPLSKKLVPQVLHMNELWCAQHSFGDEVGNTETCAIASFMNNFEYLDGRGGVLLADDKVIAFSAGAPKNPSSNTFIVHFEKGLTSYEGVYSAMNNFFMQDIATKFTFVNREEDLGIEGLRKSKLSYNPDQLIEKYDLIYD